MPSEQLRRIAEAAAADFRARLFTALSNSRHAGQPTGPMNVREHDFREGYQTALEHIAVFMAGGGSPPLRERVLKALADAGPPHHAPPAKLDPPIRLGMAPGSHFGGREDRFEE